MIQLDLRMDWKLTQELGIEKLFKFLKALVPHFELYRISTDWLSSDKYIAKARGVYGDVVIYWY